MRLNILDILLPREVKFFDYLDQQAEIFCVACKSFHDFVSEIEKLDAKQIQKCVAKIKADELKGDNLERLIITELDKTFITPIDREDIHSIVVNIDRSLDFVNKTTQKIEIYKIRKVPETVVIFSKIIVEISIKLRKLVNSIKDKERAQKLIKEIHALENEADHLFHQTIAKLFLKEKDPVEIIKFKDIYNELEDLINSVDHIAKIVGGIIVNQ